MGLIGTDIYPGAATVFRKISAEQASTQTNDEYDLSHNNKINTLFRMCLLNTSYQLCKSYPALFLVPKDISDECIKKTTKCHRQSRLK